MRTNWRSLLFVILLSAIVALPVFYFRTTQHVVNDFESHIIQAQNLLVNGQLDVAFRSHPVLQYLIVLITKLTFGILTLTLSLVVLMAGFQAILSGMIYIWLGKSERRHWEYWRIGMALTLPLLAPVMLLTFLDDLFYLGYIGLANYHNPTIQMLKPIALVCVILALRGLNRPKNTLWITAFSAVMVILSSLVKPNFVMAFIPALGIITLHKILNRETFDLKLLIIGFAIPSILVLLWQWLITYQSSEYDFHIIFSPFTVMSLHSDYLFPKFILSLMFVIQGLVVFFQSLFRDQALFLGWVTLIVGLVQNYFFAETGEQMKAGNFFWSGQIALFLMVVILARHSARYFIADNQGKAWQKALGLGTYLAHLAGGIVYYLYCLTSIHYR